MFISIHTLFKPSSSLLPRFTKAVLKRRCSDTRQELYHFCEEVRGYWRFKWKVPVFVFVFGIKGKLNKEGEASTVAHTLSRSLCISNDRSELMLQSILSSSFHMFCNLWRNVRGGVQCEGVSFVLIMYIGNRNDRNKNLISTSDTKRHKIWIFSSLKCETEGSGISSNTTASLFYTISSGVTSEQFGDLWKICVRCLYWDLRIENVLIWCWDVLNKREIRKNIRFGTTTNRQKIRVLTRLHCISNCKSILLYLTKSIFNCTSSGKISKALGDLWKMGQKPVSWRNRNALVLVFV